MSEAGFSHIVRALKHRDFRIFMTGQTLSQIGVWMQRVVVGWYTWELTQSATWLGVMSLADLFPTVFIGSLSGALADRVNRLTIIHFTQLGSALSVAALCFMVYANWSSVELLFVLVFIAGSCIAINLPARLAIVPSMVGKENMHSAVAINSLVANAGRFIGPAIAGLVIVQWGVWPAFALCAAFFGIPAVTLFLVKAPDEKIKPTGKRLLADIADGITYTFRHPGIGPLMTSMIVTSTLGKAIIAMFPAFSALIFSRGADGVAWLTGILGGGAVLGGIYMARRAGVNGLTWIFILSVGVIGGCMAVFAATDIFWLAIAITAILGAALIINGISAQTLIQNTVEVQMRGRVASLYVMVQRGGQSAGGLILGIGADLIGLRWSAIGASVICLGFWVWSMNRSKVMASTMES